MYRRLFLTSGSCLAAQAVWTLGMGTLLPLRAIAQWPADIFFETELDDAVAALAGNSSVPLSEAIEIQALAIAENGATVPVAVRSHLADTRAIALLSDSNPNPLLARYRIGSVLEPYLSVRVKMGGTGHVIALVETDVGFFMGKKLIKVTAGGCA